MRMAQYPPDHGVTQATLATGAGTNHQLGKLNGHIREVSGKLDQLNASIQAASASSERLARALNWLTAVGAGVALLGVIVAAVEIAHHWSS
jgi:CHASE3 domain sensor protein